MLRVGILVWRGYDFWRGYEFRQWVTFVWVTRFGYVAFKRVIMCGGVHFCGRDTFRMGTLSWRGHLNSNMRTWCNMLIVNMLTGWIEAYIVDTFSGRTHD